MIGSDILLFPDTGPEFLRCLRTAVLYAERVNVLTVLNFDLADFLFEQSDESRQHQLINATGLDSRDIFIAKRFLEYFRFIKEAKQDLQMLSKEGILRPLINHPQPIPVDNKFSLLFRIPWHDKVTKKFRTAWPQELDSSLDKERGRLFDPALQVLELCPPSHFDLSALEICSALAQEQPAKYKDLFNTDDRWLLLMPHVMFYLATLAVYAEEAGSGFLCWSKTLQEAVWAFRESLTSPEDEFIEPLHRRNVTEAQFAHVVLERYIPSVENYNFEEILKLRNSRAAELEAFRVAMAELATQIDIEKPQNNIELQTRDLARSKVDPAVRDLKAALYSSRMDSLTKFGKSWKSVTTGVIPAVLSFAAGAPLDASAILAAGGVVGSSLLEGVVERKKLRRASQWSILLRLSELEKN